MSLQFVELAAARLRKGIRALLAPDDEIEALREQFYVTLRAYLARIEATNPPPSSALDTARDLLKPGKHPPRWSDCYQVEQHLVGLFDEEMLRSELETRLLEARANLRQELADYYEREIRAALGQAVGVRAAGAGTPAAAHVLAAAAAVVTGAGSVAAPSGASPIGTPPDGSAATGAAGTPT